MIIKRHKFVIGFRGQQPKLEITIAPQWFIPALGREAQS
jgi:hypothetical protein